MVGDSQCRLHLAPDIFGRYSATQALRDMEVDRLTPDEIPCFNVSESTRSFVPTIYVGKKNDERKIEQSSWLPPILNFRTSNRHD